MSNTVRMGIMGTGNMARAFAAGLQHTLRVELQSVASRSSDSANQFGDEFNVPNRHSDYLALATDPDVDIVYIATPHSSHAELSMMCMESGKAVLCEKPFTINSCEARMVIEKAKEKQLFLMEAMWSRYVPAVVKLRELLESQAIGNVQMMIAGGAFMPPFDPEAYLFRPDLGGGVLLDAGVYLVSMASMVFGAPTNIRAVGSMGKTGVDEHDAIILEHSSGAIASLYISLRASESPQITLLGDRGKLLVHAPLFAPPRLTLSVTNEEPQILECPFEGNGYQFEAEEAADCILSGRTESQMMPLGETLSIMQTMDEIRQQIGLSYPMEK